MDELENVSIGVACGKCGGSVYMFTCPEHHWALKSECDKCGLKVHIEDKCKECDFHHWQATRGSADKGAL